MPKPVDPTSRHAKTLRKYIRGRLRLVKLDPIGPYSQCYWNATTVAQANRGEVVCGYLVTEHDGVLIEGIHHAVVKFPNGELIDVTQYRYGIWPEVSFIPDGSAIPSLDVPAYLDNIFVPLSHHELIEKLAAAHHDACVAQRHRAKVLSEAGYPLVLGQAMTIDTQRLSDGGACIVAEKEAIERYQIYNNEVQALTAKA